MWAQGILTANSDRAFACEARRSYMESMRAIFGAVSGRFSTNTTNTNERTQRTPLDAKGRKQRTETDSKYERKQTQATNTNGRKRKQTTNASGRKRTKKDANHKCQRTRTEGNERKRSVVNRRSWSVVGRRPSTTRLHGRRYPLPQDSRTRPHKLSTKLAHRKRVLATSQVSTDAGNVWPHFPKPAEDAHTN